MMNLSVMMREQGDRLLLRNPLILPALIKTAAAPQIRTPLAELAVRATMLLILALFQTANESIGLDLKTHSPFIDIFFPIVSHSPYPSSLFNPNGRPILQNYKT